MKTLTKIFMAVVALFAVSCVTDTTEDLGVNLGEGQTTISLSLEESRTHLGTEVDGEYPLYWSEGDKIAVNGVASNALEGVAEKQTSAKFTLNGAVGFPRTIVYPAPAEGVKAATAGQYPVTFAATQSYKAGSFAEGAAPMYAYQASSNDAVTLNHLSGVLRIAPYGDATIKALVVAAETGALAGNFDVAADGTLTAHADATNSVTVTFGEGLKLGATEADATPIYVAVPAGEYGLVSVTLLTDTDSMTKRFNTSGVNEQGESKAIKAGKVREFAAFEYAANNETTGEFLIYDEATLRNFAANIANIGEGKTYAGVKVVADIDMTGKSWTAVDNFSGVFDGGNHKIKGLTAPLFGATTNAVTIKNIHLTDVDITISGSLYVGSIALHIKNNSSIVENCSAEGELLISGTLPSTSSSTFFGGCFGYIEQADKIYGITNKVNINVAYSTNHTGTIYVGGCLGLVAYIGMEECHNYGHIQAIDTPCGFIHIGGVVSSIRSSALPYKNLSNAGNITIKSTNKTMGSTSAGGICAQHYDCILQGKHTNTGNITIEGDNYTKAAFISGVIGYASNDGRILTITDAELSNSGTLTWNGTVSNPEAYHIHMGGVFAGSFAKFTGTAKSIVNTGNLICRGSIGKNSHIGGIITGRNGAASFSGLENAKCYCKIEAIDKGENCWIGMLSSMPYSATIAFKNSSVGGSMQTSADDEGKLTLDNYMQYLYRLGSTISESGIANIDKIGWLAEDINSTPQYKEVAGIEIDSAEKLLQFAADVKANSELAEIVAITADIDMTGVEWTPIEGFAGWFNGRDFEIKGLTAPLFGTTQAAEIKNVKLTDVNISTSTLYTDTLGAIACFVNNASAEIKDCSADGKLTFTGSDIAAKKAICIAGVIGYATTTKDISGLVNSVDVTMANNGTGWIAGCIGKSFASTLKNCQNLGTVEYASGYSQTTNAVYIMGVCSYSIGHVSNCTNGRLGEDGKPTEEGKVIYNGTITDNAYLSVAGICCSYYDDSSKLYWNVENCTNYAPIVLGGKRNAGGTKWSAVAGIVCGPTWRSNNPEINNCKNYGEIKIDTDSATTSPLYAAGIVAGYSRGKLTSLENHGQITVTSTAKSSGTTACIAGIQATAVTAEGSTTNIYTDVKNVGKIVVEATPENMPNLEISGIANSNAYLYNPITNCRCFCTIKAIGFTNVGMITGGVYNETYLCSNCHIGGRLILNEITSSNPPIDIDSTNFHEHIYGDNLLSIEEADENKCGYLEEDINSAPKNAYGEVIVLE